MLNQAGSDETAFRVAPASTSGPIRWPWISVGSVGLFATIVGIGGTIFLLAYAFQGAISGWVFFGGVLLIGVEPTAGAVKSSVRSAVC